MPLSYDAGWQRIDEMSFDILKQLTEIYFVSKYSLQIDDSTLSNSKSMQLSYVRFIHNMQAQEQMLFVISLPADTRASTVFNAVERFYEEKRYQFKIYCNVQQMVQQQWLGSMKDLLH